MQATVRKLLKEKNAIMLAHNYQPPEIQDLADMCGDSLELSIKAADTDAEVHRFLRGALHGRNGLHPLAGQDRAAAARRRRLPHGRHDHAPRP
jgi:hypothetical protein